MKERLLVQKVKKIKTELAYGNVEIEFGNVTLECNEEKWIERNICVTESKFIRWFKYVKIFSNNRVLLVRIEEEKAIKYTKKKVRKKERVRELSSNENSEN